ncbi:membrane-spanning 4-domains subfamily A member 8-like [Cheilinus undulatus]|uniref:membrane-spanning 4-domains subfamily A member 8-like n=1 Tax=Cheilinus undulatus TaxID=241271 RepID=UPI001BD4ECC1|nr:membrane-spanning 4-domains subfamily A member 8-like [Cheilinus undulatus]
MSVSVTKGDRVTVLTFTTDPQSALPPICQILKSLCYSPGCFRCCFVSQHLKRIQGTSQSMLGAIQIMVGLLTIGLGAILYNSDSTPWWFLDYTMYHFWLGALFICFGVLCILSEKFPSPFLVNLNMIVNGVGAAFATTGIVLYSLNMNMLVQFHGGCGYDYFGYPENDTMTQSSEMTLMTEKCMEANAVTQRILIGINALLIILCVLELCAGFSSAILGTNVVGTREKTESPDDPEQYKPLLEDITSDPVV